MLCNPFVCSLLPALAWKCWLLWCGRLLRRRQWHTEATTFESAATLLRVDNDARTIVAEFMHIAHTYRHTPIHISAYAICASSCVRYIACLSHLLASLADWHFLCPFHLAVLQADRRVIRCPARCMSVHITGCSCILNPYIQASIHMSIHSSVSLIVCLPILSHAQHDIRTSADEHTRACSCHHPAALSSRHTSQPFLRPLCCCFDDFWFYLVDPLFALHCFAATPLFFHPLIAYTANYASTALGSLLQPYITWNGSPACA